MTTKVIELDGGVERRFWQNVSIDDGCFEWIGNKHSDGYGYFWMKGSKKLAHRVAYTIFNGPIPAGMDIDHLCRNRLCCRIDHLEAVTRQENLLRGATISAALAARTHCNHGHEFTPDNILMHGGYRTCRECRKEANRKQYLRRKNLTALTA